MDGRKRLRTTGLRGGSVGRRRDRLRAAAAARGQSQVMVRFEPDWLHCSCFDFDLREDQPRVRGLQWRCPYVCPCAPEDERMARATGKHHEAWPRVPGRARAG